MAGFDDAAKFLQLGMGLFGGFAHAMEQDRREREQTNLKILSLLEKDDESKPVLIDRADIVQGDTGFTDKLFGGGTNLKTSQGEPAFKVGGSYFALRKKTPFSLKEFLGSEAAAPAAPTPQPGVEMRTRYPLYETAPTPVQTPTPAPTAAPQDTTAGADWTKNYRALDPATKAQVDKSVQTYAAQHKIPLAEAYALIAAETDFDPKAISKKGAIGLTQLMPDTAQELEVDPYDIDQNIEGGLRYYRQQLDKFGSPVLARAAYNAGAKRVTQAGNQVPRIPETIAYTRRFQTAQDQFSRLLAGQVAQNTETATPTEPAAEAPVTTVPAGAPLVAGPGAPALQPGAPAREPQPTFTLPPPEDQETFARRFLVKNMPPAPNRKEGQKTAIGLLKEGRAEYDKDRTAVRTEVQKYLDPKNALAEHDPDLLEMLPKIQTRAQLDAYTTEKARRPARDWWGESDSYMRDAVAKSKASNNPAIADAAAGKVWDTLRRMNVQPDDIKEVLKTSGYDDEHKLGQLAKEQTLKNRLELQAKLEQQKALLPGQVTEAEQTTLARGRAETATLKERQPELLPGQVREAAATTEARGRAETTVLAERQPALLPGQVQTEREVTAAREAEQQRYKNVGQEDIQVARNLEHKEAIERGDIQANTPIGALPVWLESRVLPRALTIAEERIKRQGAATTEVKVAEEAATRSGEVARASETAAARRMQENVGDPLTQEARNITFQDWVTQGKIQPETPLQALGPEFESQVLLQRQALQKDRDDAQTRTLLERKRQEGTVYAPPQELQTELARQRAQAVNAGAVSPDTTMDEFVKQNPDVLTTAQNAVARRAQTNAVAMQQAKNSANATEPIWDATKLANVENPSTGQRATVGMSPKQIAQAGMIKLDNATQQRVNGLRAADRGLSLLETLAVGGDDDAAGTVTGVPFGKIPGIFTADAGPGSRTAKTFKARLDALKQDPTMGQYVRLYEMNRNLLQARFAIVVGGDPARLPVAEFLRAGEGLPDALPGPFRLQDAQKTVQSQFRILRRMMNGLQHDVVSLNSVQSFDQPQGAQPPQTGGTDDFDPSQVK